MPSRLEVTPTSQASSSTSSPIFTSLPSPTAIASSPAPSPTGTATAMLASSPEVQDSIGIWQSYIGVHGQKDHLIFHVVTKNTSAIPRSIQIIDTDTGQVTNLFPLEISPIPNLCTAQPINGKSYFRTAEVFFEDLPQDFRERLMGTSFTYLVEIEEPIGERVSISITEPPSSCMNLVE